MGNTFPPQWTHGRNCVLEEGAGQPDYPILDSFGQAIKILKSLASLAALIGKEVLHSMRKGARYATWYGPMEAGVRTVRWDGRNERGTRLAAGVYFVRFEAAGVTQATRLVLAD